MVLDLKRQLGRARLDRAEMLVALVNLAVDNPAVFGALLARLQGSQTSGRQDVAIQSGRVTWADGRE